jgi:hypothetical protein
MNLNHTLSTHIDAPEALRTFGYSELESRFLLFVALHSGVFLRRHFLQFSGLQSGELITNLLKRLQKNRHCRLLRLSKNASVYHLNSRAIYRATGHENLRHRRSHQVDYVKAKLLSLDYILENREFHYLPTEEEKVSFFTNVLNIPISDLPVKTYKTPNSRAETHRYFVDKFPLYVTNLSSKGTVIHFSYVDPGPFGSVVNFVNHLRSYAGLFSHLQQFRFIYIHQSSPKWKHAEPIFRTFVDSGFDLKAEDLQLPKYVQLRLVWENEQYEKLGSSELLFLNQARKKFSGARYEELYLKWKDEGVLSPLSAESRDQKPAAKALFVSYKINANYSAFGDLD